VEPLALLDVTVDRNPFGRQVNSFEANLLVEGFDNSLRSSFGHWWSRIHAWTR
jgi:glutamine amidotransferase PdxT